MARKLKTYITNLGFFELALAAPSMKAALEAWGMGHNVFHQGFARETDDPKIVAAAMARPGVVLKSPVGTKGPFEENAALPKGWSISPGAELPEPKRKTKSRAMKPAKAGSKAKAAGKAANDDRAAIISFEKEKARRQREREREAAREEERLKSDRARRAKDAKKAQAALEKAEAQHEEIMAGIEKERDKLDRRAEIERERWAKEREDLKADLRAARD